MAPDANLPAAADIETTLDQLAATAHVQSNCMFQLAIMLARIALEPGRETYKDETARSMQDLIDQLERATGCSPVWSSTGETTSLQ